MEEWLEIENRTSMLGATQAQRVRVHRVRRPCLRPVPRWERPPEPSRAWPRALPGPASLPTRTGGRPRGLVYERLFASPGLLLRVPRGLVFGGEGAAHRPEEGERSGPAATVDVTARLYRVLQVVDVALVARVEGLEPESLRVLDRAAARALDLPIPAEELPREAHATPRVAPPGTVLLALTVADDPRGTAPAPERAPEVGGHHDGEPGSGSDVSARAEHDGTDGRAPQ